MLEYRPRFLLTGEGVALRPLLLVAVAGLCIGMIPPLLWLAAWKSGHYIGDASGILDRLLPFYPFAIVNLAAPSERPLAPPFCCSAWPATGISSSPFSWHS